MRRLRWWQGVVLSLILMGLVAGTGLLFLLAPGVQRRLFLSLVAAPGRTVAVDRVRAGPGGVEIAGLRWVEPGRSISIASGDARFSMLDALGSGPVLVESLRISGLRMQDSPLPADPGDAVRTTKEAVLRLPEPLSIQQLEVDGVWERAGDERARVSVAFSVEGGPLAPETVGRFAWRATVARAGDAPPAAGAEHTGSLELRIARDRDAENLRMTLAGPIVQGWWQADLPAGRVGTARPTGALSGDVEALAHVLPPSWRPFLLKVGPPPRP